MSGIDVIEGVLSKAHPVEQAPKMESRVIAFGHRARSGKDTAAATIIEARRQFTVVKRYSFADALKREITCAALSAGGMRNLFVPDYYFMDERQNFVQLPSWVQFDENAPMDDPGCPLGKQRALLQWWGTEFRRKYNPNYWVEQVEKTIAKEKPQVALITDLRFPNELAWVQLHGFAVRVDRKGLPAFTTDTHESERALANIAPGIWDLIIENDGTLEEFKEKVLQGFDYLMETDFPFGYGLV